METTTTNNFLRHRPVADRAKETLENDSEAIKHTIPYFGNLLAPKHDWPRTIRNHNCDIVIKMQTNVNESFLIWMIRKLRESKALIVQIRHPVSTKSCSLDVRAPFQQLLKAADEYHLPKRLKRDYGGGFKEFSMHNFEQFQNCESEDLFLTSQEKQWLTLKIIESIRANQDDILFGQVNFETGQLIIPKLKTLNIIEHIYPIHEIPALESLQKIWVQSFRCQPLDEICHYFGIKISMYFAWLGHYSSALIVPAILGLIFWLFFCGRDQKLEDFGYVIFSLFNVIWATIYLQFWKRYSSELAFRWGTLDQRDNFLVEPRPSFQGAIRMSPVTNRMEPFQSWHRSIIIRYFISIPLVILSGLIVFAIMILSFQLQDWWDVKLKTFRFQCQYLSYIPKIFLAVIISLMDEAYNKIAKKLNNFENHRLETKHENNLIGKITIFINSFLSLFYIGFYIQDQARLKEQLATLLITRQIIGNLKRSVIPYTFDQIRLEKLSFDLRGAISPKKTETELSEKSEEADSEPFNETNVDQQRSINQTDFEDNLSQYKGTFDDHLEMVIQFGYVVLFSSAFPLAGLCALVNNIIKIRCDAFKLTYIYQRPFGQRVLNIGTWQNVMEYICLIAVIVNCALIGLSGQVHRMFPDMTGTQTLLLIVALEHIMLVIRFLITCAIPDKPEWLTIEMAKLEWTRREALRTNNFQKVLTSPDFPLATTKTEHANIKKNRNSSDMNQKSVKSNFAIAEIPPFRPKSLRPGKRPDDLICETKRSLEANRGTDCFEWEKSSKSDLNKNDSIETIHCSNDSILSKPLSSKWMESKESLFFQEPPNVNRIEEESTAKKKRLKQKLIKRARSVAIFSLKLKERRSHGSAKRDSNDEPPSPPVVRSGGELSCIPIEKIIQLDNVDEGQNYGQSGAVRGLE